MARLIDAVKAWKVAQRIYSDKVLLHAIKNVLDSTESEDAVEVVHGRWNKNGWNDYSCSVCKVHLVGHGASGWNYCPNCGAKMDGDVNA